MTTLDKGAAKVTRWLERRNGPATKQLIWQSCKGGVIKTSSDLDAILMFLTDLGAIVSDSDGRSPTYSVNGDPFMDRSDNATAPVAAEPEHVATVTNEPSESTTTSGEEGSQDDTKEQVKTAPQSCEYAASAKAQPPRQKARMSDDAVLALAAQRRHFDGRIEHDLELIESRHNLKCAGDTLRASDLDAFDIKNLDRIRKWLGAEPSFRDRYLVVAARLKEMPADSPLRPRVGSVTNGVRLRLGIAIGEPLSIGHFQEDDLMALESILGVQAGPSLSMPKRVNRAG